MAANQIIGGNFVDNEGNPLANGYLLFKLNMDELVEADPSIAVCSGRVIKIPLDSSGNVAASPVYNLWPNADLVDGSPTNFYLVTAYTQFGQLVWGPLPQSILSSPSPFNIGAWVPGKIV